MIRSNLWKGVGVSCALILLVGCGGSDPEPVTDITEVEDTPVEVVDNTPEEVDPDPREVRAGPGRHALPRGDPTGAVARDPAAPRSLAGG